jgi:SNF2 family DNA or RNA helicase
MSVARVRPGSGGAVVIHPGLGDLPVVRAAIASALPSADFRTGGGRIEISPHGAEALAVAAIPGLTLDWDEAARQYVESRTSARRAWPGMRDLRERLAQHGVSLARELVGGHRILDALDDHQLVDVALMVAPGGYGACIFDEQGTGKTVVVIHAFDLLVERGEVDQMIVVAPKSMVPEWERDIRRFTGDLYQIGLLVGGRRALADFPHGADVFIANYESAVSIEPALAAVARSGMGRTMLVIDESFNVKNRDARRTRALARIRELCGRSFVLCGTPAPNAPEDVVEQFNLVDFGLTFEGVRIPPERERAREVVQRAMRERGIYVRNLKENVLPDLPAKRLTRVLVDFEPIQRQAYEQALTGLIVDVQGTDATAFRKRLRSFLARRSTLLQICSNPAGVVPGYQETSTKVVALDRILKDALADPREKIVLWSFYRSSLEELARRYGKYGLVRYDGTVDSVRDRSDAVRRFQEDDDTRIFLGNPAAAGAGLTLHRARLAIYVSLSNQAAHFLQSIDRIHRRGQTRDVELMALLCDESIELIEFDRLRDKAESQRALLGDTDTGTLERETFLDDLLLARALLKGSAKA